MRQIQILLLLSSLGCATSRQHTSPALEADRQNADLAADRAELLRLHRRARDAHLQHRADMLVSEWTDSLFSVSGGRVSVGSKERGQRRFQEYLDAVEFQAWDDIVPPRIRISPDGQMAYVIVEKRVHFTSKDSTGSAGAERIRYAWLSVYEKQGGRWRLAAIASTDRPDSL
jgi:ketosteroid isomerase-like protein